MADREPSVEEIELWLRKVTRGNVPSSGDILVRGTQGWRFGTITTALGGLAFEGQSSEGGTDPIKMTAFDTEFGGTGVIEDLANDRLIIVFPGTYQIFGLVEYDGFTQDAELQIRVNGELIGVNTIGALSGITITLSALGIVRLDAGDELELFFGRQAGVWTGDIFRLELIAYSIFLDSLEDI